MMELSMRLLSIHDVDWILFSKRCTNRSELFSHLKFLSFDQIFSSGQKSDHHDDQNHSDLVTHNKSICPIPVKVICYANKSFVNSSSILKDFFTKLHPSLIDSSEGNRIKISLIENVLTVTLSFGGNDLPLWKRGYKFQKFESSKEEDDDKLEVNSEKRLAVAPLAEHHAAACFLWMISSNCRDMSSIKDSSDSVDIEQSRSLLRSIGRIIVPFAGTGEFIHFTVVSFHHF
jgi:hypothetical protein